jgi:hypothetical protein
MGFREYVEALLSRSRWSQREPAPARISSGRVSRILSSPALPPLAEVARMATAGMVRDMRLHAPGNELELAPHCRRDISSRDVEVTHVVLAYLREVRAKGNEHGRQNGFDPAPPEKPALQWLRTCSAPVTAARSSIPQSIAEAA